MRCPLALVDGLRLPLHRLTLKQGLSYSERAPQLYEARVLRLCGTAGLPLSNQASWLLFNRQVADSKNK